MVEELKIQRDMTFRYLIAIGIILLMVFCSHTAMNHHLSINANYEKVINQSGMQRMLSQRIVLLSGKLADKRNDRYEEMLKEAIDRMRDNHSALTRSAIRKNSQPVNALYFQAPYNLDKRVQDYLSQAENFLNAYQNAAEEENLENNDALQAMQRSGIETLLFDLNHVVNQYERDANQAQNEIKGLETFFVFLITLTLGLVVFYIFRPMVKKTSQLIKETERLKNEAEENFEKTESILANIIEALPIIVFGKDVENDYRMSFLNKEAEHFFGMKKDFMLGKTDRELWPTEEAEWFHETDTNVIKGKKVIDIPCEQVTIKDGTSRLLHTRKVPVYNKAGKPVMLLGVAMDITDRIQGEKELEKYRNQLETLVDERTQQLKEALSKAEEINRLKSDFLATMSHEIRTPMNGILGMAELIEGAHLSGQIDRYAKTIINSGESLLQIIDDILDFSKIEAGKLELDVMPTNLLDIVSDVARLYDVRARDKALELVMRYKPGSEQFVYADPLRIRQVLSNLLSNAVKFTEKGYIVVELEELKEEGAISSDNVKIKFSVTDTGIGISPVTKAHLFEKFIQADNSTTRKYGGTGLGLSICKSLVELMGGEIDIVSEEGKGSTFWFTVTFERNTKENSYPPKTPVLKESRILVVDDLPVVCEMLQEQLKAVCSTCDKAMSGQEALEKMQQAMVDNIPYDIIIIDYLMPGMNGEMLASAINDHEELREACLIMLTSASNQLADDYFAKKGFSAYIAKPVSGLALIESLAFVWDKYQKGEKDVLIRVDAPSLGKNSQKQHDPVLPNAKILVAEDNLVNQVFIQEILSEMHADYTLVCNGSEALDAVKNNKFHLVIMDCLMPVMDGYEAAREITKLKKAGDIDKNLPILALTANAMKGDREKCLQAGMNDYLSKPVRQRELKEKLYTLITECYSDVKEKAENHVPLIEESVTNTVAVMEQSFENGKNEILDMEAIQNARNILKDKYDDMIGVYIENSQNYITEIEKALADNNIEHVIRPAHTLKSSSKQMGAAKLSEVAKKIELTAKSYNEEPQRKESVENIGALIVDIKGMLIETQRAFERLAA